VSQFSVSVLKKDKYQEFSSDEKQGFF